MADNSTSLSPARFPAAIAAASAVDVVRGAHPVKTSSDEVGFGEMLQTPQPLTVDLLPYLIAALRLHDWALQGISVFRDAGFLEALGAARHAFDGLAGEGVRPTPLGIAVLCFVCERFAWNGISELGANVVLDDLTDDAALEALAEYLWESRHSQLSAQLPQR
jgi:hypothetical protein